MQIRPVAVFVGALVLSSVALAALPVPNPSIAGLSGTLRLSARNLIEENDVQTAAVDFADDVMGEEYSKFSKALKKAAKPMDRLDKAFGDDATYNAAADSFVSICAITTGVQLGNSGNAALLDELVRDPLRFSGIIRKNNKVASLINQADPNSKINRAKTRKKQMVVISKVAKYFEKLVKRYGKNNNT